MTADPSSPPPGLVRLGGKPALRRYLASLWQRREFAWSIAVGNLRSQHLDTALGNLWHVVNPLLLIGVYWLVFGVLLEGLDRGVDNFVGFLAVGIFVFNYCQRSISSGASSIVSNIGLIRSLQFPRAVLPISAVIQQLLAFGSGIVVMLVMLVATGEPPQLSWFMLAPLVLVATLFSVGGALIAARLTDQIRDVQNVLPYIFRLLFYLSGVLYSVDAFVDDERLLRLFLFNPFYDLVSIARHHLMASHEEPLITWMWLVVSTMTVLFVLVGTTFFRAGEKAYGRG